MPLKRIVLIIILLFIVGCDSTDVEYPDEIRPDYPDRDPYENIKCECIGE